MPDYHSMYLKLAGAQANAIDALKVTTEKLIQAQREAEDILLEAPEPDIRILPPPDDTDKP